MLLKAFFILQDKSPLASHPAIPPQRLLSYYNKAIGSVGIGKV